MQRSFERRLMRNVPVSQKRVMLVIFAARQRTHRVSMPESTLSELGSVPFKLLKTPKFENCVTTRSVVGNEVGVGELHAQLTPCHSQ